MRAAVSTAAGEEGERTEGSWDYPQTARAELKDNTSVSRSYITSYHSPNFTQASQDWKHGWTKHFAMADIASSCCQRQRSVQPAALRVDMKKEGGHRAALWHCLTDSSADADGFGWETAAGLTSAENRALKKKKKKKKEKTAVVHQRSLKLMTALRHKRDYATFEVSPWKEIRCQFTINEMNNWFVSCSTSDEVTERPSPSDFHMSQNYLCGMW